MLLPGIVVTPRLEATTIKTQVPNAAWRPASTAQDHCRPPDAGFGRSEEARSSPMQTQSDRRRIKEFEFELRRKEKALAEAAAPLVLSK